MEAVGALMLVMTLTGLVPRSYVEDPTVLRGDPPSADPSTLLAQVAAGSSEALGRVYDLHAARVYAFARRLLGEDAAAEDLLQEVFLTLPSAARRFRGESRVQTFLLSIAHNHARHHVRSAARRRSAMNRLGHEPTRSPGTPDADAERRELAETLARALDALSLEQRVAFVLCDVEEQTSVEAAAVVGVPEGTIRTRLFHARKRLRELLGDRGERR